MVFTTSFPFLHMMLLHKVELISLLNVEFPIRIVIIDTQYFKYIIVKQFKNHKNYLTSLDIKSIINFHL